MFASQAFGLSRRLAADQRLLQCWLDEGPVSTNDLLRCCLAADKPRIANFVVVKVPCTCAKQCLHYRLFEEALSADGIVKVLRVANGKAISNARIKTKGDVASEPTAFTSWLALCCVLDGTTVLSVKFPHQLARGSGREGHLALSEP